MPHVVTQSCCSDASCVYACPVNCIHPTPDEPDFLTAEMLHIDPASCVDCGACVSACPVDAIVPRSKLTETQLPFLTINADFYKQQRPKRPLLAPVSPAPTVTRERQALRVAIVGSGPSAMYAADELLTQPGVKVDVYDRLSQPHGLARLGVAPDHEKTRQVSRLFDQIAAQPGFRLHLGVEVGKDITHDRLLDDHHAVVYAVGASRDRELTIPGADLDGRSSATDFVAWYNGHPDHAHRRFDLSSKRAVVIGNGNVALDVARILTIDPDRLIGTNVPSYALTALRESNIEEVHIVGRRGVAQSAFTVPEFAGLLATAGIDVSIHRDEIMLDAATIALAETNDLPHAVEQKLRLLRRIDDVTGSANRRIVLRYLLSPTRILGDTSVTGVEFDRMTLDTGADGSALAVATGDVEIIDTGLVLTSIGYRGVALPGVPFDDRRGVIPNDDGRVLDAPGGVVVPGSYVTGWIKRGPSGYIGTNKSCAQGTIRNLVEDFNNGTLADIAPRPGQRTPWRRRRN
ncbi:FAD-dependent oxidoreductase [Rhodococcoides yunnanense]|uniref:FAD-dependent oxidoreductase n=1 Tax=Rhodococcoides yunnanense TaxID=278209 RepID=UPI000AB91D35|nr:FAD-dependent oxidoreductase [Rhodococcus yunnanensis]